MSKRAAGYIRVSTTMQAEDGLSLEAQEARIREKCADKGWELVEVFGDKGISAHVTDRPELARLLASLDTIDYIIVWRFDRFGRKIKHMLELNEQLERADVGLVSINDEIDTSTPMGAAMQKIMFVLGELESDTTSERVKAVMSGRTIEKGLHHGKAPYGFEKPEKRLIPVDPAAAIVRRIWTEIGDGKPQKLVCGKLDAEKIAPPGKAARWTPSTISRMVRNVAYGGKLEINGEIYEGDHDALIEPELFERVQKLVKANSETASKGKGRTPARHLFVRGHLKCAECNGSMLPRTNARDGKDFYMCLTRRDEGKDACSMPNVPRLAVDQAVFDYFAETGIDLEATRERLSVSLSARRNETSQLLKGARKAERAAAEGIERVKEDYTAGDIDAAEWRELREDLREQAREAAERAAALEAELADADSESAAVATAEDGALARLAEVRAAVAGEVDNPDDVEGARASLRRMFEAFWIAPATGIALAGGERAGSASIDAQMAKLLAVNAGDETRPAEVQTAQMAELGPALDEISADGWIVVPEPRLEVVEDLEIAYRPVLGRESLPQDAKAWNVRAYRQTNVHGASSSRCCSSLTYGWSRTRIARSTRTIAQCCTR
jgi:site-specific DNA recombinase